MSEEDLLTRALNELVARRRGQAQAHLPYPCDHPVGRAAGVIVYDEFGNAALDFGPGGLANAVGHANPQVLYEVRQHLHQYLYTGEDHLANSTVHYAARLADRIGEPRKVLVTAGVWEAWQLARRIADGRPVADETLTAIGRTGYLFGYQQRDERTPEVMVLGPGAGGGLPFGAVVATPELFERLGDLPPLAGHPLSCAAATAVLDQVGGVLLSQVRILGNELSRGLTEVAEQFPAVLRPPSGVGLLQRISTVELEATSRFRAACRERGLLTHPDLTLTPPLTVTAEEVTRAVEIVADVCLDWS